MSNESKVREQFEAWVRSIPPGHGYNALDTWQASRAAALEEAADFIERRYISDVPFHKMRGYLASAIRALAAKEGL